MVQSILLTNFPPIIKNYLSPCERGSHTRRRHTLLAPPLSRLPLDCMQELLRPPDTPNKKGVKLIHNRKVQPTRSKDAYIRYTFVSANLSHAYVRPCQGVVTRFPPFVFRSYQRIPSRAHSSSPRVFEPHETLDDWCFGLPCFQVRWSFATCGYYFFASLYVCEYVH